MKLLICFLAFAAVLSAYTEHSYTHGIFVDYENLNYRGEGTIDINIAYTTNFLKDHTMWFDGEANEEWEKDFDSFFDDEQNQLYLQFEIDY